MPKITLEQAISASSRAPHGGYDYLIVGARDILTVAPVATLPVSLPSMTRATIWPSAVSVS